MLDTNSWIYFARTRLNDQTGHTIKCTFYGKDVAKWIGKKHGIHAHYPKEFTVDYFLDDHRFSSSLRFKLSENAMTVLKQNYEFQKKSSKATEGDLIQLGYFVESENHSYYSDLYNHNSYSEGASIDFDS